MYKAVQRDLVRLVVVDEFDRVDIESWWSDPVFETMTTVERERMSNLMHEMAVMMQPVLLRMMTVLDD